MEYFIGGIRGLGTWGATWFIDRNSSAFETYKDNEPIQLLLEVTYANGQIIEVRDVSNENGSYFKQQMRTACIKKTIKNFKNAVNS